MASELPNALDARFRAFLVDFRVEALRRGVAAAVFDRATAGLTADPLVVALAAAQPEHLKTPRDYLETIVSEARIEAGRAQIAPLGDTLRAIENAYGVDRHVLIALWGVETNYGSAMGDHGVVRSLSTLAVEDGRRATFWRNELLAALRILDRGDINPERMTGSWAGAMGHTQFMPSTYMAHAVDFDGDGRRNIWGSAPDALASAASYLRASGWRRSEPWDSRSRCHRDSIIRCRRPTARNRRLHGKDSASGRLAGPNGRRANPSCSSCCRPERVDPPFSLRPTSAPSSATIQH